MDKVHPVVNERGHDAAHHPRGAQRTNDQQHDDGRPDPLDVACNSFFEMAPGDAIEDHPDEDTKSGRRQ